MGRIMNTRKHHLKKAAHREAIQNNDHTNQLAEVLRIAAMSENLPREEFHI